MVSIMAETVASEGFGGELEIPLFLPKGGRICNERRAEVQKRDVTGKIWGI